MSEATVTITVSASDDAFARRMDEATIALTRVIVGVWSVRGLPDG